MNNKTSFAPSAVKRSRGTDWTGWPSTSSTSPGRTRRSRSPGWLERRRLHGRIQVALVRVDGERGGVATAGLQVVAGAQVPEHRLAHGGVGDAEARVVGAVAAGRGPRGLGQGCSARQRPSSENKASCASVRRSRPERSAARATLRAATTGLSDPERALGQASEEYHRSVEDHQSVTARIAALTERRDDATT